MNLESLKKIAFIVSAVILTTGCSTHRIIVDTRPDFERLEGPWGAGKWRNSVSGPAWEDMHASPRLPELDEPDFTPSPVIVLKHTVGLLRFIVSLNSRGRCQFEPSCGRYALMSLRKYGPFYGYLMTGDRLLRCNRNAWKHGYTKKYVEYEGRYFYDDPPEANFLPVSYEYACEPHESFVVSAAITHLNRKEKKRPAAAKNMSARRNIFRMLSAPAGPTFKGKLAAAPDNEKKLFSFALDLVRDEQLYRAITEFYRFISFYPSSRLAPEARLLAAECHFLAGKWRRAKKDYERAREKLTGSEYMFVDLRIATADYFLDRLSDAVDGARKVIKSGNPKLSEAALYLVYLARIRDRELREAARVLGDLMKKYPDGELVDSIDFTPDSVLKGESLPGRSPTLGAIMSAVVPGSGQIYSGRYAGGASAFITITGLGYVSYKSFEDDADVTGWVTGALAVSFYLANVYNGASAARAYNNGAVRDFYKRVKEQSFFDHLVLSPDDDGVFAGLGYEF